MDGSSACGFFDLILGLFIEADVKAAGKVIVLDEAHKYLSDTQSGTSTRLTDSLLSVIRQQRHLATRVIISTQEPTVVPSKFLDLCSFIIAHRFSSPAWLKLLAQHVSAAESSFDELFNKIVSLRTGQAIIFAASGIGMRENHDADPWHSGDSGMGAPEDSGIVAPIGQGYLHVQSRLRVTTDGGHSILAVNDPGHTTRFGRVLRSDDTEQASTSHASPGGTSASAERTAGAAAPPCTQPIASVTQAAQAAIAASPPPSLSPVVQSTPLSSTHSSEKVPNPAVYKSQSAPSVFVLTGALHKFRPLVVYLQKAIASGPCGPILVKTAREYFIEKSPQEYDNTIDGVLDEALQLGLIQYALSARLKIQLVPGAEYRLGEAAKPKPVPPPEPDSPVVRISKTDPLKTSSAPPTSSVSPLVSTASGSKLSTPVAKPSPVTGVHKMHLTDKAIRFVPLVEYLLAQKQSGCTEIKVATIRKRFGAAVQEIIQDAITRNIVCHVKGAAKSKICLVPTTITW
ncbi:hypothetical protein PHLGIDRAFT_189642 [Phlebiopsis gigantea 11061_1 CR5-6]|uniref:ATPase AAA-type core domain-containing protein n=1 Tax=Phlebiopsis gigantea (strain 11061_1 CR5-6) TaxID=745531 RepID=A0A0C3PFY6_PHLG1|nr:hypothetical protein PHLGIDRAFT_189642 [Phlebiopsis gigantea 11061_1 CR5-6]